MSETPSDEQTTNERSGSGFWRIRPTVTDLVLAGGFVLANIYWWRREQTIRAGLRTTREWRREAVTGAESGVADDESAGDLPARDALQEAAELVNAAPADLPDRVETLDDKVRALTRETEHLRERWAAAWWQGRETQRIDGCRVVATTLPDGSLDDARALAKFATEHRDCLAVVVAPDPDAFAVGVGGAAAAKFDAAAVASRLAEAAGGGAGGTAELATGGGVSGDVEAAIQSLWDCTDVTVTESEVVM